MAGVRLRHPSVVFGVDAMLAPPEQHYGETTRGIGLLATASVTGRPGKYAFVASAIGGAIIGTYALVALSQAGFE